jgi:hypothetical protein
MDMLLSLSSLLPVGYCDELSKTKKESIQDLEGKNLDTIVNGLKLGMRNQQPIKDLFERVINFYDSKLERKQAEIDGLSEEIGHHQEIYQTYVSRMN